MKGLKAGLLENLLDDFIELQNRFLQFLDFYTDDIAIDFLADYFLLRMRDDERGLLRGVIFGA